MFMGFLFCHNWLNRLLNFLKALDINLVINFIIEVIPLTINVLNFFQVITVDYASGLLVLKY
jgi:hypothetical protein